MTGELGLDVEDLDRLQILLDMRRRSAENHVRGHRTLDEKPEDIEVTDSKHKSIYIANIIPL